MNSADHREKSRPSVAIVGGGLAGLAAAARLCEGGLRPELFEARRQLGGRAGSFIDPANGERVDHCQHVAMGCCTHFLEFCRRTGIEGLLRRHDTLHFFGPNGDRYDLRGSRWLPAPLHLATSLLGLGYLSWRERFAIGRALLKLARTKPTNDGRQATVNPWEAAERANKVPESPKEVSKNSGSASELTIGAWLRAQGQSQQAVDRFWSVVLVSALGETVDRASFWAARKVFVDGFMSSRTGYHVLVPTVSLGELYDRVAHWLREHGATLHLSSAVARITGTAAGATSLEMSNGDIRTFDAYIVAVPWQRVHSLFDGEMARSIPELRTAHKIESSPISSLHLTFDRPLFELPHAILIDRLAQWVFYRGARSGASPTGAQWHDYQVVISAARNLAGRDRDEVLRDVRRELQAIWPASQAATLQHWRLVTQPDAVFSYTPGFDRLRPAQRTAIANVLLAGDWTSTGWPATMESAVRSGDLAAECLMSRFQDVALRGP